MRKRIIIFPLLVFIFLLFSNKFSYAQSSDQIYNSFLESYRKYQKTVPSFNAAKLQYLSFQSVDSQLSLIPVFKKMLTSEVESMLNFSLFIRARLVEATSVLNYQENFLFVKLDDEITFLNLIKKQIEETSSLEDLKKFSNDLAAHYEKISTYSYQIKFIIETYSANKFLNNLKIEKEKITAFIKDNPNKSLKMTAGENKLNDLEEDYLDAVKLYKDANELGKKFDEENNKNVWKILSKLYTSLNAVIVGYKNVILSIK